MKMYLRCCKSTHPDILLPDGQSIFVGRSAETKIVDSRCSRKQLELKASYASQTITVTCNGSTASFIGDSKIVKGQKGELNKNETLYIIQELYPHTLFIKTCERMMKINIKVGQQDTLDSTDKKKKAITDFFGPKAKKAKLEETADQDDSSDEVAVKRKLELLQKQDFTVHKSSDTKAGSSVKREPKTMISKKPAGWSKPEDDLLVFESKDLRHSSRIVAFDLDSTLITTKSGKTFAVDYKDWKIMYSEIPAKLKQLIHEGIKLVIITNQLGIGKGKVKESDFKTKIEAILSQLDVPCQVLAIIKRGKNRKPNIGSFKWLRDFGNGGLTLESDDFTYVGDAAGRPKNWAPGKKKDFSCSDRLFALNLGTKFFTPEEFFLAHKPAKFEMPEFNPKDIADNKPRTEGGEIISEKQEVIVMVGYPACGKSSFVKAHFVPNGYVHVNRDTMKTWQKCVAACKQALASGKSVVIDNTNTDIASRKRYVDCAKERNCQIRCFVSNVTIEHAFHNNRFRELSGSEHDVVPPMILYSFRKNFVEPKLSEGFNQIVKFNFVPQFDDDEQRAAYLMFLD